MPKGEPALLTHGERLPKDEASKALYQVDQERLVSNRARSGNGRGAVTTAVRLGSCRWLFASMSLTAHPLSLCCSFGTVRRPHASGVDDTVFTLTSLKSQTFR